MLLTASLSRYVQRGAETQTRPLAGFCPSPSTLITHGELKLTLASRGANSAFSYTVNIQAVVGGRAAVVFTSVDFTPCFCHMISCYNYTVKSKQACPPSSGDHKNCKEIQLLIDRVRCGSLMIIIQK